MDFFRFILFWGLMALVFAHPVLVGNTPSIAALVGLEGEP